MPNRPWSKAIFEETNFGFRFLLIYKNSIWEISLDAVTNRNQNIDKSFFKGL